jgi:uncharacterized protein YjbJ (UPF0337 family)
MGIGDKLSNAAEKAKGKAKQKVGEATDNKDLKAKGRAEQTKADVKRAAKKAKDASRD